MSCDNPQSTRLRSEGITYPVALVSTGSRLVLEGGKPSSEMEQGCAAASLQVLPPGTTGGKREVLLVAWVLCAAAQPLIPLLSPVGVWATPK